MCGEGGGGGIYPAVPRLTLNGCAISVLGTAPPPKCNSVLRGQRTTLFFYHVNIFSTERVLLSGYVLSW